MNDTQDYRRYLNESGLKHTRQREAILEVISSSTLPMTVDDVFMRLKANHMSVSMATVYRTMETMNKHGVLQSVTLSGDNRMAYVFDRTVHHHYIVCTSCNKILPISHCPLAIFENALTEETGFVIQGHRLDLYGLCPDCQRKQNG